MTDPTRLSMLRGSLDRAVKNDSPGGATITARELADMKKIAAGGAIALVDLHNLKTETEALPDGPERTEQLRAIDELRGVAVKASQAQGDAIGKTLGMIDTLNPFAYARWAMGGAKAGIGETW